MKTLGFISILAALAMSVVNGESEPWSWSAEAEVEQVFFASDGPGAAFLQIDDGAFYAPRLSLSVAVQPTSQWYLHARARVDRGFDPGTDPDGAARLDEAVLRFRPLDDQRLRLQVGKFPTVFGTWPNQHAFHDDAFLTPPLAYGEIMGVNTRKVGAVAPATIRARNAGRFPGIYESPRKFWVAQIWGPAYSPGISVNGTIGKVDYAFEMKNAFLGSAPDQWEWNKIDDREPTFSGRLGYRPDAAWNFGVSASRGPYLADEAAALLPAGVDIDDLSQTLVGLDARWAHHDWMVSSEVVLSEFESLESGDLRSLSYYLQARWKAAPGKWLAARVGQVFHNDSRSGLPWADDLFRGELAFGWRITSDLLIKTQYSYTHGRNIIGSPGEHLFGTGIGWRF